MVTYVDVASDYSTRYEGCYGILGDEVIYASEFQNIGNKVEMMYLPLSLRTESLLKNLKCRYACFPDSPDHVEIKSDTPIFVIPKLGFINTDFYCLFYERRHKKPSPSKYRRGLRPDTIDIYNTSDREISSLNLSNVLSKSMDDMFTRNVYNLFFPKFYGYNEALNFIISGEKLSVALSSSIAIKASYWDNSIALLKNLLVIGDYSEKDNGFKLRTDLFDRDIHNLGIRTVK